MLGLLGLLGLRIFEACGSSISDRGEEYGHRDGIGAAIISTAKRTG
jgi:hypothetical protein